MNPHTAITVYDALHMNKVKGDNCPWGSFPCQFSSEVCVKQENFCDGVRHCPKERDDESIPLCCKFTLFLLFCHRFNLVYFNFVNLYSPVNILI